MTIAESLFLKEQSPDQLGFTKGISYLLGAVLRVECQRWALDTKKTCFGVTFDGKAAFPSVDRDIQVRELYTCGEDGDLLQYSRNTYKNTVSHMKQNNKLSREFTEWKGSRQGHKRAAGHFKSYINPCLTATDSSELGFWIGPICVTSFCIADDTYVLSGDPRKLQDIINIVGHYGKRYRLIFGADKTKVTITGSKHDMKYYKEILLWSIYGQKLVVADDNEHLGLIVSGTDEEIKNIDKNIESARKTMFGLLGQTLSYRCKLSPLVQYHIWTIYIKPVLRSGLPALPIRPNTLKTLTTFHHKTMRGILKLSQSSPLTPLYFLLGEIPMEATIHLDMLSLFWNIWSNPQTKVFEVVKYLLKMTDNNSLSWSAHLRIISQLYSLPDPPALMEGSLWSKEKWKEHIKAVVISYHELSLRKKASRNYKLRFLNVQVSGLSGKPHPVLSWILTTQDVMRARIHIKMVSGDYLCHDHLAKDRGLDPACRLCQPVLPHPAPKEDQIHLLTICKATADTRSRTIPTFLTAVEDI